MSESHNPLAPDDVPFDDNEFDTTIDKTAILRHMMNLLQLQPTSKSAENKNENNNNKKQNSMNLDTSSSSLLSSSSSISLQPDPFATKIESCCFLWDIRCLFIF
jgi:hypothetical protein